MYVPMYGPTALPLVDPKHPPIQSNNNGRSRPRRDGRLISIVTEGVRKVRPLERSLVVGGTSGIYGLRSIRPSLTFDIEPSFGPGYALSSVEALLK
jgi:hypothetical protein